MHRFNTVLINIFPLYFSQWAVQPVCCDSVLFQELHSAHRMCIAPLCIEPFILQYFSAMKYNKSFLFCPIYHMLLPYYRAIHLNKCILILLYIFKCKFICSFFHECILQYKEQCDILPDLVVHLFTFICKYKSFTRFYKTIVHPWFF